MQELPDDFESAVRSSRACREVGPAPVALALQAAARQRHGTREELATLFVALLRVLGFLARSVRSAFRCSEKGALRHHVQSLFCKRYLKISVCCM